MHFQSRCGIILDVSTNVVRTRTQKELIKEKEQLSKVENQLETARMEVEKPFEGEAELTEKMARLSELNALLDMGEKTQEDPEKTKRREPHLSLKDKPICAAI